MHDAEAPAVKLSFDGKEEKPAEIKHRGYSWLLTAAGFIFLFLAVFSLAFTPLRSSQDEWWHLKTGQWIWEHGKLPLNDLFTYTGEDLRWYNHEWLSQLIFYGAYSLGDGSEASGMQWLIGLKAVVVALTFCGLAWLCRVRGAGWAICFLVALIAADVSRRTIYARPPIFSYAFMVIFLLLFAYWKSGTLRSRWLFLMIPLTVLWANFHGMVLLAGAIAGGYCGGQYLENLWRVIQQRKRNFGEIFSELFDRKALLLTGLTAGIFIAMIAQPSGYHLFFLSRNFTADPLLQSVIAEMLPTPFLTYWNAPLAGWAGFLTPWIFLGIVAGSFAFCFGRLRHGADYILLPFFMWQGFAHHRLLPLFAIISAGCLGGMLYNMMKRGVFPSRFQTGLGIVGLPLAIGWFNFTVAEPPPHTFYKRNMDLFAGRSMAPGDYPKPLMDFLVQSDLPPRMMSESNYCGYAMWRLSPEKYKLFTDNRFDLFGSKYFREELIILSAAEKGMQFSGGEVVVEGWSELADRYGIQFFVIRPGDRQELHTALRESGKWKVVFHYLPPGERVNQTELGGYVVWLRNTSENQEVARKAAEYYETKFPAGAPLQFIELWKSREILPVR